MTKGNADETEIGDKTDRCREGDQGHPAGNAQAILCRRKDPHRAEWLGDKKMGHVRGVPYHPQTQGKIERWHQTLKNRILLDNYFFPEDLEAQIETFVDHYNHQRYHESINNLTPADVYFGRGQSMLKQRERIKRKIMETRRVQYRKHAA